MAEYIFQEYLLVFDNTIRSLERTKENKGQFDTSSKSVKFKYDLDY